MPYVPPSSLQDYPLPPRAKAKPVDRTELLMAALVLMVFASPLLVVLGWSLRGFAMANGWKP